MSTTIIFKGLISQRIPKRIPYNSFGLIDWADLPFLLKGQYKQSIGGQQPGVGTYCFLLQSGYEPRVRSTSSHLFAAIMASPEASKKPWEIKVEKVKACLRLAG